MATKKQARAIFHVGIFNRVYTLSFAVCARYVFKRYALFQSDVFRISAFHIYPLVTV